MEPLTASDPKTVGEFGWVTIGATALLALHTVGVITVLFATRGDPTVKILSAVTWIFAVAAVITLWGKQARDFFDAWHRTDTRPGNI